MKLQVNIAFHYVPERLQFLNRVIDSLLEVRTQCTRIIVNSNVDFDCKVQVDHSPGLADPFCLTWEHKRYMPAFLESDFTHYAYLEDDLLVTQTTIDYWTRTRALFKRSNLIFLPATLRFEINETGRKFFVDCTAPIKQGEVRTLVLEGQTFVSHPEPYQGMFIMDRELVEEHVQSPSYVMGQNMHYGIRESANSGNLFENIPEGFWHRSLIPLENVQECWIHHLPNNYHGASGSPYGKLPVEELLVGSQMMGGFRPCKHDAKTIL